MLVFQGLRKSYKTLDKRAVLLYICQWKMVVCKEA